MKQATTTKFTYTIDDLKKNLAAYHDEILTNSVLLDIKRCIIDNHGIITDFRIQDAIEDNAPLIGIDFSCMDSIKTHMVEGAINILAPEVVPLLESEQDFDIVVVNSKGQPLIHINQEEIG